MAAPASRAARGLPVSYRCAPEASQDYRAAASPEGVSIKRPGPGGARQHIAWDEVPAWTAAALPPGQRESLLAADDAAAQLSGLTLAAIHQGHPAPAGHQELARAAEHRQRALDEAWAAIMAAPAPAAALLAASRAACGRPVQGDLLAQGLADAPEAAAGADGQPAPGPLTGPEGGADAGEAAVHAGDGLPGTGRPGAPGRPPEPGPGQGRLAARYPSGTCAACGDAMAVTRDGQQYHPLCEPSPEEASASPGAAPAPQSPAPGQGAAQPAAPPAGTIVIAGPDRDKRRAVTRDGAACGYLRRSSGLLLQYDAAGRHIATLSPSGSTTAGGARAWRAVLVAARAAGQAEAASSAILEDAVAAALDAAAAAGRDPEAMAPAQASAPAAPAGRPSQAAAQDSGPAAPPGSPAPPAGAATRPAPAAPGPGRADDWTARHPHAAAIAALRDTALADEDLTRAARAASPAELAGIIAGWPRPRARRRRRPAAVHRATPRRSLIRRLHVRRPGPGRPPRPRPARDGDAAEAGQAAARRAAAAWLGRISQALSAACGSCQSSGCAQCRPPGEQLHALLRATTIDVHLARAGIPPASRAITWEQAAGTYAIALTTGAGRAQLLMPPGPRSPYQATRDGVPARPLAAAGPGDAARQLRALAASPAPAAAPGPGTAPAPGGSAGDRDASAPAARPGAPGGRHQGRPARPRRPQATRALPPGPAAGQSRGRPPSPCQGGRRPRPRSRPRRPTASPATCTAPPRRRPSASA